MKRVGTDYTVYKVDDYEGRTYSSVWFQEKNPSAYYDSETDKQCHIPIGSITEIRQALGV